MLMSSITCIYQLLIFYCVRLSYMYNVHVHVLHIHVQNCTSHVDNVHMYVDPYELHELNVCPSTIIVHNAQVPRVSMLVSCRLFTTMFTHCSLL